jgi:hypothetical protein
MAMAKRFDIGKFWKGRNQPASVRQKKAIAIKKLWNEGKWKPWNKGRKLSKAHKEKLRISNIRAYESEKLRLKISKAKKKQYENPLLAKKIDRALTSWWKEHPNVRKKYAEKVKSYFRKNPRAFGKFLAAGKNPLKRNIRAKQGFLVRSKGERKIADFLYKEKIPCIYEGFSLMLDGWICTPDFYLPEFNAFVEFYGGYPGSWKKKVIKNRLYKKHRIPVIAVTPTELRNLDYYLADEARKMRKSGICRKFRLKNP